MMNRTTVTELLARMEPIPTGPVSLPPEYLEAVRQVEARADNQSGADKSWVLAALRRNRAFFERAELSRAEPD